MDTSKISQFQPKPQKKQSAFTFDDIIIVTNNQVKAVVLPDEVTTDQYSLWQEFKSDPLSMPEPDFHIIEEDPLLYELKRIQQNQKLIDEEKNRQLIKKRLKWQQTGRFALSRWGRQNAIAAGLSLMQSVTKRLYIVGRISIPDWAKYSLPAEVLHQWPSESDLVKRTICKRFGNLYQERFNHKLEDMINVFTVPTDLLTGLSQLLKRYRDLYTDRSVALLSSDYSIRRLLAIMHLFSTENKKTEIELMKDKAFNLLSAYLQYALNTTHLRDHLLEEQRWERAIIDDDFLMYWVGYLKPIESISLLQNTINVLKNEKWSESARKQFKTYGLNFDEFTETDLHMLRYEKKEALETIKQGLRRMNQI